MLLFFNKSKQLFILNICQSRKYSCDIKIIQKKLSNTYDKNIRDEKKNKKMKMTCYKKFVLKSVSSVHYTKDTKQLYQVEFVSQKKMAQKDNEIIVFLKIELN